MKLQPSDDETEYIDSSRCITSESLEMRSMLLALPAIPTHSPGVAVRPQRLAPEEEIRIALEEKVQSDDDDGSDYEEEEEGAQKKAKKKRRRGPDKKKVMFSQVNLILDHLQCMQRNGRSEGDFISFLSSMPWTDKKINEFKTALTGLMEISNKSASATESAMMRYLTGLQNDHPDAVLANECREMTFQSLQKATTTMEDRIFEAEMEVKRLKNALKVHKFFLEVHQEQTHDRCNVMGWVFNQLIQIESRRFSEAASKTSARKEFGRRGGGGGSSSSSSSF